MPADIAFHGLLKELIIKKRICDIPALFEEWNSEYARIIP
jgi:hypothetical protein